MPIIEEKKISSLDFAAGLGKWVKENTIAAGEAELKSQVAMGFDPQPVVITDGVPRRDYNQVKPFGKIEFARRANMADAVLWALDELRKKSPVLTGRYVATHTVMINGVEVVGNLRVALSRLGPADRVQIVNPQPYARKIEGARANKKTGRGKRAALSMQAKRGVYQVIHRALLARYGRVLFVDFTYVKLDTGVKVWGDQGGSYYNRLKKNGGGSVKHKVKRVQRDQVYPALKFFIQETPAPTLH